MKLYIYLQNKTKVQIWNISRSFQMFTNILWKFPKIAEDFWGRSEDLISNTNKCNYGLRVKHNISEVIKSLLVRIWKIHHPSGSGCWFVWILSAVFSSKTLQTCYYNRYIIYILQKGYGYFMVQYIATSPGWDNSPPQVTPPRILLGCPDGLPVKSSYWLAILGGERHYTSVRVKCLAQEHKTVTQWQWYSNLDCLLQSLVAISHYVSQNCCHNSYAIIYAWQTHTWIMGMVMSTIHVCVSMRMTMGVSVTVSMTMTTMWVSMPCRSIVTICLLKSSNSTDLKRIHSIVALKLVIVTWNETITFKKITWKPLIGTWKLANKLTMKQ